MVDRAPEVLFLLETAWEERGVAPGYVIPRILFLKTVVGLLWANHADRLSAIENGSSFMIRP